MFHNGLTVLYDEDSSALGGQLFDFFFRKRVLRYLKYTRQTLSLGFFDIVVGYAAGNDAYAFLRVGFFKAVVG